MRKKLVKDNHKALETLLHIGPKKASVIINNSPNKFLQVIRILAKFALDGTIPLEKHHIKKLQRHKNLIRDVAKHQSGKKIKKIVMQKGGSFFKSVLTTLLPLIPMIL